jgi:hypothetical protein
MVCCLQDLLPLTQLFSFIPETNKKASSSRTNPEDAESGNKSTAIVYLL